jgi:hypothetical protein
MLRALALWPNASITAQNAAESSASLRGAIDFIFAKGKQTLCQKWKDVIQDVSRHLFTSELLRDLI